MFPSSSPRTDAPRFRSYCSLSLSLASALRTRMPEELERQRAFALETEEKRARTLMGSKLDPARATSTKDLHDLRQRAIDELCHPLLTLRKSSGLGSKKSGRGPKIDPSSRSRLSTELGKSSTSREMRWSARRQMPS